MKLHDVLGEMQKGANKIYPEDIAGMLGLPSVGEIFYVDPGKDSGVSGGGKSRDDAFVTVYEAQQAMTADQDDVIIVAPSSSTGRTAETHPIVWNKRRTHMIGGGPLRKVNPRAGLSFGDLSGEVCFTVSATNCSFGNLSIASFNDNNILVDVTAAYNTFDFVHFQGIGHATTGDDTAARSLRISGADETIIRNSTIGLDTVTRSVANASLELTGTCARTEILGCDFPMFADNAGAFWLKADTGNCYERYLTIQGCKFMNPTNASSTALTAGMKLSATGNGDIYFLDNVWRGATDLATDYTNLYNNQPVFDAADAGLVTAITT